ncbi:triphosphate tunnel metalloenzyme 3-like [Ziziphus jujuba]|uniref:Triphosphate tunnel metalloenzyme 3-like n=1 Tax=Ziziphus jujuba TaxID=326968 RepID=A0A6P6G3E7_ZIZJJ|nr:triphosphate tunnel metalloenzyme 3-like [Ziziphus jujuba]
MWCLLRDCHHRHPPISDTNIETSIYIYICTNTHIAYLMGVELKLRIPSAMVHCRLKDLLSPFHVTTQHQENFFFDGANNELSSHQAVLFLRLYDDDTRCFISLKARAVLVDGVCSVEEDEEDLDPVLGRACVAEPEKLLSVECGILRRLKEEFGVLKFVGLGGYANVRNVYEWKGLKLEVDEIRYEFGTCYEIECETTDPEGVKKVLEEFLKENGIEYSYSVATKSTVFRAKKLPQLVN